MLPPPPLPLSPDLSPMDLNGALVCNAPSGEPLHVSRRRLEQAIRADGVFDHIGAASIWYAYTHHPELFEAE